MIQQNTRNTFERFGNEFQSHLIKALISDKKFYEEIKEILQPEFFTSISNYNIYKYINSFYTEYKNVPTNEELKILISQTKDEKLKDACLFEILNLESSQVSLVFFKNESLKFCKNQKIRSAIEQSIPLIELEDYERIKKLVNDATQLDIKKDLGHDYLDDIDKRLNSHRETIPTGYALLDVILNGGWGNGELAVVCGKPSMGKSFFLINFAKKARDIGKNVIYFTLELSDRLIGTRMDSLISEVIINDVNLQKEKVKERIVDYSSSRKGKLIIKQYPTKKASVTTLQSYLQTLYTVSGFRPDLIVVDYADLLKPSVRGENKRRHDLACVYEDLRGWAVEEDLPVISASQVNREGAASDIITMEFLAEAYEKAAIADIILGATRKATGEAINYGNLYIAKNRPAGIDGQTLPLIFQTTIAKIEIPESEELIDQVKYGKVNNIAKSYFDSINISIGKNVISNSFKESLKEIIDSNKK